MKDPDPMPDAPTYSLDDLRTGAEQSSAYAEAARALAKLHAQYAKTLVGEERHVALALVEANTLMARHADALVALYQKAVASCP
jgi:uncharacterized protein YgfB (UPF0149 family)